MNRLKYVNKLLENDDISDYIKKIETSNSTSPPKDLKDKILFTCYGNYTNTQKQSTIQKHKVSFIDMLKVAGFTLIITMCTELFMNTTYASNKQSNNIKERNETIDRIGNKINSIMSEFSDFMLTSDMKGE